MLRPAPDHARSVHALLRHVRSRAPGIAPEPLGIEPDGRERLRYVEGDAPRPPFPAWSQTDRALASAAALLRAYHDAVRDLRLPAVPWSSALADPRGGALICHNDVCPENVVFREGRAVALIDFDYAAPGRPVYDLAQLAKMWIPIDASQDAARLGRGAVDVAARLRVVADAYGLPADRAVRAELVDAIGDALAVGDRFVQERVEQGDPAFVAMWRERGGRERTARRRAWYQQHRSALLAHLA